MPSEEPSAAMMKENSPTWAMLMEHFTVVLSDCLETSAPSDTQRGMPARTSSETMAMMAALSAIACGDISMPTETKKTVPKRSLMGLTSFAMRSACMVPARMEPARNAPSAAENPMALASATMHRHSARDAMSRISSVRKLAMR